METKWRHTETRGDTLTNHSKIPQNGSKVVHSCLKPLKSKFFHIQTPLVTSGHKWSQVVISGHIWFKCVQ